MWQHQLIEYPTWLSLGRRALYVLVKESLDAILPQPFGQREYSLNMPVGIVAVADEHSWA
jgi:hypothetical protein